MGSSAAKESLRYNRRQKTPTHINETRIAPVRWEIDDFLAATADGNNFSGTHCGLKHNKLKPGPAQRELFARRLLTERFRRWGVKNDDLGARSVMERFKKLSRRVSEQSLGNLLDAVEGIADAERAKAEWNPKEHRNKFRRLSRAAVSAGRLLEGIAAMFPPPWDRDRAPIGELISLLTAFIGGAITATPLIMIEKNCKLKDAHAMVATTRRSLRRRTQHTYWELIRDLVWLAVGKRSRPADERTIRRYLDPPSLGTAIPEKKYWNQHWGALAKTTRLATDRDEEPFLAAAQNYLKMPFSSIASEK